MEALWKKTHPSVLSLTFENTSGERLSSGSAFKVGKYLITNNHVIQVPGMKRVTVRSVQLDGMSPVFQATFGHLHFRSMLKSGKDEATWDYAVMEIDHPDFQSVPALSLVGDEVVAIGSDVCFFGYQFDQQNLAIHKGIVSSSFDRAGVRYIQIDGSVNHGNSGGPLVDVKTGLVLGIVTRKATGLTEDFKRLDATLAANIDMLTKANAGGSVVIMGIDPVSATRAVQEQIRVIARNIGRSANVGIGYAYHVSEVRSAIGLLEPIA